MLRDGYYLSVFAHANEIAHLKKINLRHDQGMALWEKKNDDVKLIHYWEFERISGLKKHGLSAFNEKQLRNFIDELLKPYKLTLNDMVEVWGTSGISTTNDYTNLGGIEDFTYHSVAHLFSSILSDTEIFYNSKIIALAVDGAPDNVVDINARDKHFYTGAYCDNGNVKMLPVPSPGILWLLMKLKFNLEEGSLMALGSASSSESYLPVDDYVEIWKSDDILSAHKWLNKIFADIETLTEADSGKLFSGFDERFSEKDNKISMVVKIVHEASFKMVQKTIEKIATENGIDTKDAYLSLSGGFSLNCPINTQLMSHFGFKGFIAPPCVSDTGIPLGMGLHYFYNKMNRFNFKLENAFHGSSYDELFEVIELDEFKEHIESVKPLDLNTIVEDIEREPIIWFNGRSEIGPRALGNRSIIADPRKNESKDRLNEIKLRQWWRPVAPIVLEDHVGEWFEDGFDSPYMLQAFYVKQEKKNQIPAVLHLDDTSRVQTIKKSDNPILYSVMESFHEKTGIPIICNTSLNDKGEPIVNKIQEALNFGMRRKINVVYINEYRIVLKNFEKYSKEIPQERETSFENYVEHNSYEGMINEYNPHNLSDEDLVFYLNNPSLFEYDIQDKESVKSLKRILQIIRNNSAMKKEFEAIDKKTSDFIW